MALKTLFGEITSFNQTEIIDEKQFSLSEKGELRINDRIWSFAFTRTERSPGQHHFKITYKLERGTARQTRLSVVLPFSRWKKNNFVFMPGAVYDGNRFRMLKVQYPAHPFFDVDYADPLKPDIAVLEIPGLSRTENSSMIVRPASDASTPAAGFFSPSGRSGTLIYAEQKTALGVNGFELIEEDDTFTIELTAPCVRRRDYTRYKHVDTAPDIETGTEITLSFDVHEFPCQDIASFYRYFMKTRKCLAKRHAIKNILPFSRALEYCFESSNSARWVESAGLYSVARGQTRWHLGWTGGFADIAVLFHLGDERTKARALKNCATVLENSQAPSGFFRCHGDYVNGQWQWRGDRPRHRLSPNPEKNLQLLRSNADALYLIMKFFLLLKKSEINIPEKWEEAALSLANAFLSLWKQYGQLGWLLDVDTGKQLIGGSFGGACAPAGLMLCSNYFNRSEFKELAVHVGDQYNAEFEQRGFTYGGPGDSLFVPDSESAFSLLESCVVLFEETGDDKWMKGAETMAAYCSSWCCSYKYEFPRDSTFAKLDMDATGAVQANLQNQHGAPGICTLSGDSLLKLYRATGNEIYLRLLRDIAHNVTQYLGTPERPISLKDGKILPTGDMSEKVFFQDHGPIGEIAGAIDKKTGQVLASGGWPEVACMLSCMENPGVYFRNDTGFLMVLDHLEADVVKRDDTFGLTLKNPFNYPIVVKILAENKQQSRTPLGSVGFTDYSSVSLEPGEDKTISTFS